MALKVGINIIQRIYKIKPERAIYFYVDNFLSLPLPKPVYDIPGGQKTCIHFTPSCRR